MPHVSEQWTIDVVIDVAAGQMKLREAIDALAGSNPMGASIQHVTEALIEFGRRYPDDVVSIAHELASQADARFGELLVYAVFGAYIEQPSRHFGALTRLAESNNDWVRFAVAESLVAGLEKMNVANPNALEKSLELALRLLNCSTRECREKAANYLAGSWFANLDVAAMNPRERSLWQEFFANRAAAGHLPPVRFMTGCICQLILTDWKGRATGRITAEIDPTGNVREVSRDVPSGFFTRARAYLVSNDHRKAALAAVAQEERELVQKAMSRLPILISRMDKLVWVSTTTDVSGNPAGVDDPDLKE